MLSNLIELLAFGLVSYGVDQLAGRGWACVAGGLFLALIGAATDDAAVARAIRKVIGAPRVLWLIGRHRRAAATWMRNPTNEDLFVQFTQAQERAQAMREAAAIAAMPLDGDI